MATETSMSWRDYHSNYDSEALLGRRTTWGHFASEFQDVVNNHIPNKKRIRVVTLGISGYTSAQEIYDFCQHNFDDFNLYFCDLCGDPLLSIKNMLQQRSSGKANNVSYVQTDIRNMPFIDSIFHFGTSDRVLLYIPTHDYGQVLKEGKRIVSAPIGILSMTTTASIKFSGLVHIFDSKIRDFSQVLEEVDRIGGTMEKISRGNSLLDQAFDSIVPRFLISYSND